MDPLPLLLCIWLCIYCAAADTPVSSFDFSGLTVSESTSMGGRCLRASRSFARGDVLCQLPIEYCLLAHDNGAIRGLVGQTDFMTETAGDLRMPVDEHEILRGRTWDVQLALGLLDATTTDSLHAKSSFWKSYTSLLPGPTEVTVPFCYADELLEEVQSAEIVSNILTQRQRLAQLFPSLLSDAVHPRTSGSGLSPLLWAFAACRSRCVHILPDYYAVIPIIDVANHAMEPSAEVNFLVSNSDADINSGSPDGKIITLCATRDLAEGDEVTISYGDQYSNRRLFVQYGFVVEDNPFDRVVDWPKAANGAVNEGVDVQATAALLKSALKAAVAALLGEGAPLVVSRQPAVEASLVSRVAHILQSPYGLTSPGTALQVLRALAAELAAAAATLSSTLEQDQEELLRCKGCAGATVAVVRGGKELALSLGHYRTCLQQRVERKELLRATAAVVDAALALLANQSADK